jgi:regulator of replication initiation timing
MTAKAATKKRATRKPSAKEGVRQASEAKKQADAASQQIGELSDLVRQSVQSNEALRADNEELRKKVEELAQRPTKEQMLANHDQNERVINDTLGIPDLMASDYPEKPDFRLPDGLREVSRRMDMAKNNPAIIRKGLSTEEVDIGQLADRALDSEGPAAGSLESASPLEDGVYLESGKFYSKSKYEIEMFMQEQVLIRLHDSTDETQIPLPESINGGRSWYFIRGRMQWVPRLAIEPMARAKKTTYTQRKVRHENGTEQYVNIPHTALMYPFEVIEDNDRGKQWLRNILAEA